MSRLLLDAHTLIWWDSASSSLGSHAKKEIQSAEAVYVSAVSEWELAIKAGLGKLVLRRTVLEATLAAGFEPLPVKFEHAQAVRTLDTIHKDPFDRLLVAVALVEGFTLVSADRRVAEYPVRIIEARR